MEYLVILMAVLMLACFGLQVFVSRGHDLSNEARIDRLLIENRRLVQLLTAYKLSDRSPEIGHQYVGPGPFNPETFRQDAPDIGPNAEAGAPPPDALPETAVIQDLAGIVTPMLGGDPERG
ncbi:MAG TPA: hypothetical protein ENH62_04535 [Marinobacter sp.]|uniref:Uncharacterized protein n=1 Tax=marine sediment metagenome TaxID=412755 RepID=A0A0F9S4H9_9ZZZZ|nr:hypothetical protein [Marinobacter sp.]